MKYVYLSNKFYSTYKHEKYPEIPIKDERPWIMIQISINGIDFALSLRIYIKHQYLFQTASSSYGKCGVDYSKAIVITDNSYIDNNTIPKIRPWEHKVLKVNEDKIKKEFEGYFNKYKKAVKKQHIERNKKLCQYSTLQYFHTELGI